MAHNHPAGTDHARPARVAAALEGAIFTAATITAVTEKTTTSLTLMGQVLATVAVLWLGHTFAHGIGGRVGLTSATTRTVRDDLGETWPMLAVALPQVLPFLGLSSDVLTFDVAYWVSYGIALATVAACGAVVARQRAGQSLYRVRYVGAVVVLGGVLILLKELLH